LNINQASTLLYIPRKPLGKFQEEYVSLFKVMCRIHGAALGRNLRKTWAAGQSE